MSRSEKMEIYHLLCDCGSAEHQIMFSYYKDDINLPDREMYIDSHLTKRPFFKRLFYGIRYIFGHQSRYGAFDEVVIFEKDLAELEEFIAKFRNPNLNRY